MLLNIFLGIAIEIFQEMCEVVKTKEVGFDKKNCYKVLGMAQNIFTRWTIFLYIMRFYMIFTPYHISDFN